MTLTGILKCASTFASVDFSNLQCWESDSLILAFWFDMKVSVF